MSPIGHSGWGWVLPGAKWGASRLIHVLPKAADGRPGLPAQRHCRHPGWVPQRALDSTTQRLQTMSFSSYSRSAIGASGSLIIKFCPPVTGPLQSHGGLGRSHGMGGRCQAVCRRGALNRPREVWIAPVGSQRRNQHLGWGQNEMTVMSLQMTRSRAGRLPWFELRAPGPGGC